MTIKNILKKLIYGHKADSLSYVSWLKSRGMRIGENVTIYTPTKCSIDETRPFMIEAGNNVEITEGITILTHGYDWTAFKHYSGDCMGSCSAVTTGNNVFVGMNTTILKGSSIGNNCIIGANSLLTGDTYPDNSVIVGSPARVMCDLDTYYKKRAAAQLCEAKELYKNYKKSYDSEPPKEIFREFFWLFEDRNMELIPCFQNVLKLGGEYEKADRRFRSTNPQFDSYEDFLNWCRKRN